MPRAALLLCGFGVLAMAARAQPAPPDPAVVIDRLEKQLAPFASAWLNSADPRVEAWGAYLVLRDQRTDAIPVLLSMLEAYPVIPQEASQLEVDRHDAMLGVLDALIQFDAPVPAADAQRIYPEFPVQSLVLLARSQEDTADALLDIFRNEQRWQAAWLAVGNLLSARRAAGFAAAVIEGMTVHLQVIVTEPNRGRLRRRAIIVLWGWFGRPESRMAASGSLFVRRVRCRRADWRDSAGRRRRPGLLRPGSDRRLPGERCIRLLPSRSGSGA